MSRINFNQSRILQVFDNFNNKKVEEVEVTQKEELNNLNNNQYAPKVEALANDVFAIQNMAFVSLKKNLQVNEDKESSSVKDKTDTGAKVEVDDNIKTTEMSDTQVLVPTDVEDLWEELNLIDNDSIIAVNKDVTAETLYNNLEQLLNSDNVAIQEFAKMFNDAINKAGLNENEAIAFISKVFENIQSKFVNLVNSALSETQDSFKSLGKFALKKLDRNENGSYLDELKIIVDEQAAKIKQPSGDENNINLSKLLNIGNEEKQTNKNYANLLTDITNSLASVNGKYLYQKLPDMLLSDDAGIRRFANLLCDSYEKLKLESVDEKTRINQKIIDMMTDVTNTDAKGFNALNGNSIKENTLTRLDANDNGSVFDEIENIINSEELKLRYESLVDDFYDIDSMYEWIQNKFSEEKDVKTTGLSYDKIFELANDQTWNDSNNSFFGHLWRNVDEIDTDGDKKVSYDEFKAVIGDGIKSREYRYPESKVSESVDLDGDGKISLLEQIQSGLQGITSEKNDYLGNIKKLDDIRAAEYKKLNSQEKLDKVIEEAKRYCTMMGWNDYLEVLNGNGGHWKIVVGGQNEGAAGTCDSFNHKIHIGEKTLDIGLEDAVGVLMHELTHATHSEFRNSIKQENDCDLVKENYLDSVGLGKYGKESEEKENINNENINTPLYADLPRENDWWRNFSGDIAKGFSSVWNWIKGWF